MIVVDVGCAGYGGDYSIERLIAEFDPAIVYGFDPSGQGYDFDKLLTIDGTRIVLSRAAAWIFDGHVRFHVNGLGGRIDESGEMTPCVDLARFILELPATSPVVLKIDAEGAEYELLEYLNATGADRRLELAWVEWHLGDGPSVARRLAIEERLGCEVTEWRW